MLDYMYDSSEDGWNPYDGSEVASFPHVRFS